MNNSTVFSGVQMNWFAVGAAVFCLSLAGGVSAEEKKGDGACMADAEKLCKGVEKGEGRVMKCLKEHQGEVSSACKENLGKMKEKRSEMKEKMGEMKEACQGDKEKLCKDVKPGGGAILKCLKEHEGDLSSACKQTMSQAKERKK